MAVEEGKKLLNWFNVLIVVTSTVRFAWKWNYYYLIVFKLLYMCKQFLVIIFTEVTVLRRLCFDKVYFSFFGKKKNNKRGWEVAVGMSWCALSKKIIAGGRLFQTWEYRNVRSSQFSSVTKELGLFPSPGGMHISSVEWACGIGRLSCELYWYIWRGFSFSYSKSLRCSAWVIWSCELVTNCLC